MTATTLTKAQQAEYDSVREWAEAIETGKKASESGAALCERKIQLKTADSWVALRASMIHSYAGCDSEQATDQHKARKNTLMSILRADLRRAAKALEYEKYPTPKLSKGCYTCEWKPLPVEVEDTPLDAIKEAFKEYLKAPLAQNASAKFDAAKELFEKARRAEAAKADPVPQSADLGFDDSEELESESLEDIAVNG